MATGAGDVQAPPQPDPLRHHTHYADGERGVSPYAGGSSFMERVAEAVASRMSPGARGS